MIRFTYGTMAAGKTTLALQLHHQLTVGGRRSVLWTFGDRSGTGVVTSRIGISAVGNPITVGEDLTGQLTVLEHEQVTDLVVDEVQFATVSQVDQLVEAADRTGLELHLYGLAADFMLNLFDGAARLFAVADVVTQLPIEARCWCGRPGRCNARVDSAGNMVTTGPQQLIADVEAAGDEHHYEVLCRDHYRNRITRARASC